MNSVANGLVRDLDVVEPEVASPTYRRRLADAAELGLTGWISPPPTTSPRAALMFFLMSCAAVLMLWIVVV